MKRRRYIMTVGTGLAVGAGSLAGCGAPGGGDGGGESPAEETPEQGTPGQTETTAPGQETPDGAGQTPTAAGTQQAPNEIAMLTEGDSYLFDPIGLFVEQGETITWVLESGTHSTTSYSKDNPQASVNRIPDDAESWNSDTLSEQGAEFTYTFEVTGTYDYYCIPHKSLAMVGRIVCGEPSGLEGNPPDGPVPSEQMIVDQGVVSVEDFNP